MNFDYNIPKIGEKAWIAPNAAVIGKVNNLNIKKFKIYIIIIY